MPYLADGLKFASWEFLDSPHVMVDSGTLTALGLSKDTYGHILVKPGTTLAKITGSNFSSYNKLIVKAASPSYGPGSDVTVGLLRSYVDLANGDLVVAYVTHGRVREALVTDETVTGTLRTTANAWGHGVVKTDLPDIQWV